MKHFAFALLAVSLTACASGYSQFYEAIPGSTPENIAQGRAAHPPATPLVEYAQKFPEPEQLDRSGYGVIGISSFNSGYDEPEKNAVAQGRKVGADLVLIISRKYTGSVSTQVPLTIPTTTTSHTTGSATAIGPGGTATAYGNSTTTTQGSTTTYIPVSVDRFEYNAMYLVKRKIVFGARLRDLTDEERSMLQSNSGVVIAVVVNDSPAFRNDMLVGDIVVKIDEQAVYGLQAAIDAMEQTRGQEVKLTIFRNRQFIEKRVKLPPK